MPKPLRTALNEDDAVSVLRGLRRESKASGERFEVVDGQTGRVIGDYGSRVQASRKADKMDNEYGAVRYRVRTKRQGGGNKDIEHTPLEP